MDAIAKNIAALIPTCLDEIITQNRDKTRLRLAVEDDFKSLPLLLDVIDSRTVKDNEIQDWRMIRLESTTDDQGAFFMIGYRKESVFITSDVKSIEYKDGKGLVLTQNSLYRLGKRSDKEPETGLLLHICASFWMWGFGGSLGILHIFY
ncbi:MAG: hypothetical protein COZ20_01660 [Gallionellales bacterium CG_4_10_14_3_um_filter_54_96]|nr:MAG: hypothetical protein COW45_06325 [Gallionellales bacterium CG17_big_fil_post_rev_8_21_14_2_50_54_146]PIX03958.1 MAG: hypothetical protein COZ77_09090 [Gallionellales bacterium CG_4_8_14_3_um_filter_54_18]PIY06332.1 MAG: hypothetical protein COZ20_01660 [Gallionellales bacterium CG_4_10_14_3_um_filter_54_96]PJC05631.1 MAG: hypothetical protein CO070_01660 [Gallionellales bacterium CG_4_9_14_0_8_um_filter_55_61]